MRKKYSEIMKLSSRNSRSQRMKTTRPTHRGSLSEHDLLQLSQNTARGRSTALGSAQALKLRTGLGAPAGLEREGGPRIGRREFIAAARGCRHCGHGFTGLCANGC